ncbi:MAG TPA: aldo/keto reductase [Terriglobales bacterium]|nr:aldo/keto reductase [Terriglobales bacterium]
MKGRTRTIDLNDGNAIPQLGLGVWQIPNGKKCEAALLTALEAGYRHIDTASFYGNEESVGAAIRSSGIPRAEIFVTTKLWNSDHGDPGRAFETSLRKLKLDYVDLYLIHYPVAARLQSWRVLARLKQQGKARSIGVSNFTIRHLTDLLAQSDIVPAVNQVEFHPYLYQRELLDFCVARGIVIEAYSPLTQGHRLKDPKLIAVAKRYAAVSPGGAKSTAQILIRWAIQHNLVVIPKSANPARIRENADVFDFEISAEDMRQLDSFHENLRTCWDPTNAP